MTTDTTPAPRSALEDLDALAVNLRKHAAVGDGRVITPKEIADALEPIAARVRQEMQTLRHDVEAYRGALGYSVAGSHDGRLTNGTTPACGLCDAREQELQELRADRDVPDQWKCETCGFVLTKAILRASDGAVGMDTREIHDICPNDGTSLRRVTWREDAENANRVGLEMFKRAEEATTKLSALTSALEPLRTALEQIRDEDASCGCTCNTDDCCAKVGVFCSHCIAAKALESAAVRALLTAAER